MKLFTPTTDLLTGKKILIISPTTKELNAYIRHLISYVKFFSSESGITHNYKESFEGDDACIVATDNIMAVLPECIPLIDYLLINTEGMSDGDLERLTTYYVKPSLFEESMAGVGVDEMAKFDYMMYDLRNNKVMPVNITKI